MCVCTSDSFSAEVLKFPLPIAQFGRNLPSPSSKQWHLLLFEDRFRGIRSRSIPPWKFLRRTRGVEKWSLFESFRVIRFSIDLVEDRDHPWPTSPIFMHCQHPSALAIRPWFQVAVSPCFASACWWFSLFGGSHLQCHSDNNGIRCLGVCSAAVCGSPGWTKRESRWVETLMFGCSWMVKP